MLTLAEWLSGPPVPCPLSEKSARRWTDLADIRGDRKSLMKVNNPSGPEDEEKPGPPAEQLKWWTYGMQQMNINPRINADQMFFLFYFFGNINAAPLYIIKM